MLVIPENIETNKILKNRTFNFGTPNRMYGNLVLVATDTYDDYNKMFNSRLFKPQQLFSVYTPRKVKPLNRSIKTFVQKDVYADIRSRTSNFLKIGKAMMTSYAGRNLAYNMVPEYYETEALEKELKGSSMPAIHLFLSAYLPQLVSEITVSMNYEKAYLIFPITTYDDNLRQSVNTDTLKSTTPMVEFLKSLRKKVYNKDNYKGISRIFFINPNVNALVAMDPSDPSIVDQYLVYFDKINRLNKANNDKSELDDVPDDSDTAVLAPEDDAENTKQQITNIVLNKMSSSLNAKLTDYDAADSDEQGIITTIDKKVGTYLDKPENIEKPFNDLVGTIEQDKEIANKAIDYVERKKISEKQTAQLQKNLDKETEIVSSIPELSKALEKEDEKTFEPEKIPVDIKDAMPQAQASSLTSFDKKYNEIQAPIDLVNILTSLSDQQYLPATLDKYVLTDTSDDLTLKNTLAVRLKTIDGKYLSYKIDIPTIINDHCIKVNGNTYIIQKQLCRLPIVKTNTDTVEILSNYQKITCTRTGGKISRKNSYLEKVLANYKTSKYVKVEYGNNAILDSKYKNDFEYEEFATTISAITTSEYRISTNRPDVETEFGLMDYPDSFSIDDKMTPIGFALYGAEKKNLLFIKDGVIYEAEEHTGKVYEKSPSMFDLIMLNVLHENPSKKVNVGVSYMYSKCKFLTVIYPIFVLVSMGEGMTSTLKRAKINWKTSDAPLAFDPKWVEVRFKNKWFYYEGTIENTMLLNVLYAMHTGDYDFEDFDTPDPYVDYCHNYLGQPRFVRTTTALNLSKMIDPITRDVLIQLHLPTNILDLLLLANNMLTNSSYIQKNDMCNYRVRGNEQMYAILYSILAMAYMRYQTAKWNKSNKEILNIPQNSLISTLISQSNVSNQSVLNPVLELESSTSCSPKGFKGINLGDAYTVELRSYDSSMDGILSANSTPFSGAVAIQRSLTLNPKINTTRGFIPTIEQDKLGPENRLSAAEMLSFATPTRSDPPRTAMEISQSKHGVPVVHATKQLLSSGMDRTIPYMLSDKFCFKAKKDGKVDSIDQDNQVAILKYSDGTYDAIDLKETLWKNSNSGFYINQESSMKYKVGESFKKGYILAYNPSFFDERGDKCTYTQGTLAKVAVTAGDFVFEDSTYVTQKLCDWCATDITMAKAVSVGPNAIIHNMVKVGDIVDVNDELMNFTTSFEDSTTTKFLQDLMKSVGSDEAKEMGNEKILSKYAGRIADIEIYYNVPFETLSDSLQKLIKDYKTSVEKRKRLLEEKGIHQAALNLKITNQLNTDKVNGAEFNGVLIIFYTTHREKLGAGDKITYSTALKGVISTICPDEKAPFSEYRENEEICGLTASSGIPSRLTMDVFPQIYGNKLLIELGRWVHKTWNS